MAHFWNYYIQISARKNNAKIELPDVVAWQDLYGINLEPWELNIIFEIDDIIYSEQQKEIQAQRRAQQEGKGGKKHG